MEEKISRMPMWGVRNTSFLSGCYSTGRGSTVLSSLLTQGSHGQGSDHWRGGEEGWEALAGSSEEGGENEMERILVRCPGGGSVGSSGER